jgi:hypothetical protein
MGACSSRGSMTSSDRWLGRRRLRGRCDARRRFGTYLRNHWHRLRDRLAQRLRGRCQHHRVGAGFHRCWRGFWPPLRQWRGTFHHRCGLRSWLRRCHRGGGVRWGFGYQLYHHGCRPFGTGDAQPRQQDYRRGVDQQRERECGFDRALTVPVGGNSEGKDRVSGIHRPVQQCARCNVDARWSELKQRSPGEVYTTARWRCLRRAPVCFARRQGGVVLYARISGRP